MAKKFGKYTLIEQIGKGGYGEVYKAADPLGNLVALKVIRAALLMDGDSEALTKNISYMHKKDGKII